MANWVLWSIGIRENETAGCDLQPSHAARAQMSHLTMLSSVLLFVSQSLSFCLSQLPMLPIDQNLRLADRGFPEVSSGGIEHRGSIGKWSRSVGQVEGHRTQPYQLVLTWSPGTRESRMESMLPGNMTTLN